MTMRKKLLITIACLSVILCTLVTGTIAWLIDDTETITNTFTPSKIEVNLTETEHDEDYKFQMIPGKTYAKNPTVTVTNDIPCYVFVKVEESFAGITYNDGTTDKAAVFSDFLTYTVADGWTQLKDNNGVAVVGVYYRTGVNGTPVPVLANNQIQVKNTVNKAMMDALYAAGTDKYPTLKFTAHAIQSDNLEYNGATEENARALVAWNTLNGNN